MKTIKIFAPATVANLGSGFDVLGMAIDGVGDVLEISIDEAGPYSGKIQTPIIGETQIKIAGNTQTDARTNSQSPALQLTIHNTSGVPLPGDIESNVMTPAVRAFLTAYANETATGTISHSDLRSTDPHNLRIQITVLQKILPGSGIGSSAASSAGAVVGLNELLGRPFPDTRLVEFAMEGESLIGGGARHADNVAPAILGGVVLIRGYEPLDIVKLPIPDNFFAAVVHPHITVTTKDGRGVLPREIPLKTATIQWGNVGGLVAGLALGDMALVGRSVRDVVAEPARKHFIPGYDELRSALLAGGALGSNIAGSGPAVFAVADTSAGAESLCRIMSAHFSARDIACDVYASKISGLGARPLP